MSQDLKREAIIEAAIKRFAHFGVGKTTMTEIGNDLSLSKASLYYYFPDKISLYAAVLKSITQAGVKKEGELLQKEEDPLKAILLFLELRTDFIIKYHNILEYLRTFTPATIPPALDSIFVHLRSRELERITALWKKARKKGRPPSRNLLRQRNISMISWRDSATPSLPVTGRYSLIRNNFMRC